MSRMKKHRGPKYTIDEILDFTSKFVVLYAGPRPVPLLDWNEYGWNIEYFRTRAKETSIKQTFRDFYKVQNHFIGDAISSENFRTLTRLLFRMPLEDVPLYIEHRFYHVRMAAAWRLELGK